MRLTQRNLLTSLSALILALILLLPAALPAQAQTPAAEPLTGRWEGELSFQNVVLTLVVTFVEQDGALSAAADIPQQAATGLPASALRFEDGALHFELFEGPRLATFDGALQEDGAIEGDFTQAGVDGTFRLARAADVPQIELLDATPQEAAALKALDATLEQEMEELRAPGAAIAVVMDGRVLYRKAFGVASVETGQPLTPDMLFRIGSTTKSLTALALSIAAGEGIVDLHAPIGDAVDGLDPALAKLTGAQLLSHTAGFKDEGPSYGPHDPSALGETARSWTADSHLFTQPGEVFSYANPGIALAGLLLQEAAGAPYDELIEQLVLQPLGMAHSTFQPTQAMTFPLSQGHSAVAGGAIQVVRPYSDNAGYWPAGFLITNVDDLARFAIALSSGGTLGGHQAIPAEAVELMSSPHSRMGEGAAYGYGLMLREQRGVRIVEHGGAIEGFTSLFRLAPDHGFGVIILANKDGAAFEKTADRAMELLLPLEPSAEPEQDDEPIALSQAELKRYAGVYAQMAEEALEVRIDDGQLVLVLPGGELSLTPLGDDRFTLFGLGMSAPASVEFIAGPDGAIEYLTLGYRAYKRQ